MKLFELETSELTSELFEFLQEEEQRDKEQSYYNVKGLHTHIGSTGEDDHRKQTHAGQSDPSFIDQWGIYLVMQESNERIKGL